MHKVFRFKTGKSIVVTAAEREVLDFLKMYLPKDVFNLYAKMNRVRDIIDDVLKKQELG